MKYKKGDLVWFEQPTVGLDTQEWSHHRIPAVIWDTGPNGSYSLSATSLHFPEEMFTPRNASEPTPCWSCSAEPFGFPRNLIPVCPHCKVEIPKTPLTPGSRHAQSQQLDTTCWKCWGELHCHICGADAQKPVTRLRGNGTKLKSLCCHFLKRLAHLRTLISLH